RWPLSASAARAAGAAMRTRSRKPDASHRMQISPRSRGVTPDAYTAAVRAGAGSPARSCHASGASATHAILQGIYRSAGGGSDLEKSRNPAQRLHLALAARSANATVAWDDAHPAGQRAKRV